VLKTVTPPAPVALWVMWGFLRRVLFFELQARQLMIQRLAKRRQLWQQLLQVFYTLLLSSLFCVVVVFVVVFVVVVDVDVSMVRYINYYRAMFCMRGTSHGPVSVCLCLSVLVCLSVTSRSSTKTAKRRITQTTPHNSPGTLVF